MESSIDANDALSAGVVPEALSSRELARLVDQHIAAQWRGDERSDHPFFKWLASCWRPTSVREPGSGATMSVLAAGGLGIRWFETPSAIIGIVPGHAEGHYLVSRLAIPPRLGQQRTTSESAPRPAAMPG